MKDGMIARRGGTRPSEENELRILPDALRIAAKQCGAETKFISDTERISYLEIDNYSDRLAARLVARNVRPGDRVIVGLPNSAEFMIACFAVWKAQAVVVALDHCIRSENLRNILEEIEPTALIAENSFADKVRAMPEVLRFFHAFFVKDDPTNQANVVQIAVESLKSTMIQEAETCRLPTGAQADDLATITFTSGSTAAPKGVMHTHRSILACASFTLEFLRLSNTDVVMVPLPLHHVLAFRRSLTCVLARCTLVVAHDIFIMNQFAQCRPTGLVLVPSACNFLMDNFSPFFAEHGGSLRYVEIGSEPLSLDRLSTLQVILPDTKIHLTYGLTEGRVGYLKPGPDGVFDRLASSNQGLEVRVVDSRGHSIAEGDTGEILITGSGLFKGYWGDSIEAQTKIQNDGFRTGDMGALDANCDIQLMGRMDDILKVCGHKINPREIEGVLHRHPCVAEAVVVGAGNPQEQTGGSLQAFVVPKKGMNLSAADLGTHCRERLELYKVPARFYFRNSFPKTPLGKIQRHLVAQSVEV